MRKRFKKALSLVLTAAMTISLASGVSSQPVKAADGAATGTETEAALNGAVGSYKAIIGFQTDGWDCRQIENAEADALYNAWLVEQGKEAPNYNGVNIYLDGKSATISKSGASKDPENVRLYRDTAAVTEDATVTDAVMTKDGEYTIKISNLNLKGAWRDEMKDKKEMDNLATVFQMLRIDTDIPFDAANANVKVTAKSIKLAGEEIQKDLVLEQKHDEGKIHRLMIADTWDPKESVPYFTKELDDEHKNTTLAVPDGAFDIEITFAIEGVDWASAPLPSETAAPTPTPAAPQTGDMTPPPVTDLSKPFDIYLAANVNEAMTPSEGARIGADGKAIQASVFASQAIKAKIDVSKNAKNEAIFDGTKQDFVEQDSASATISKTGEYTLSTVAKADSKDLAGSGALWFPLLIDNTTNTMPADYTLAGKSITIGEGDSAKTYSWPAKLYKDKEESVRISVCNEWEQDDALKPYAGPTTVEIPVKKDDKIFFNFYVVPGAAAPIPTATPAAISTAPATSYDAYLGFQTDNWSFRNTFNDKTYGLDSKEIDFKNEVGYWSDGKLAKQKVTIKDAEMTDNTTYTVSISDLNLQTLKGAAATDQVSKAFNMVYISTNIPLAMKNVTVKNATLKIDGNEIKKYEVVPCKGDAVNYYQFMLADGYAPNDGTKDAAYPSGALLNVLPTSSIEVSYTIAGVDFDRHDVGYAKGKTFTSGNFKYKVTKTAVQSGSKTPSKGTVQVVGLSKTGKKKTSISLGATVKKAVSSGAVTATYKITTMKSKAFASSSKLKKANLKKATNVKALSSKAFYNCKNLTSVVLSKKMTKLPAGAFQNCKKLSSITCNAKLKSVSKTTFKGCKKKIKIAGKSKAANKKKIKKVYKKVK